MKKVTRPIAFEHDAMPKSATTAYSSRMYTIPNLMTLDAQHKTPDKDLTSSTDTSHESSAASIRNNSCSRLCQRPGSSVTKSKRGCHQNPMNLISQVAQIVFDAFTGIWRSAIIASISSSSLSVSASPNPITKKSSR